VGLTSGLFLGVMIAVAVIALAVTVGLWPALTGRGPAVYAGRAGLVAVSQVLVIAAFAVFLNDSFTFFNSWSSLFGNGAAVQRIPASTTTRSWTSRPIVVQGIDLGPVPGGASLLPQTVSGRLAAKPPSYYARHRHGGTRKPAAIPQLSGKLKLAVQSVGEVLEVTVRGQHTGISSSRNYVYLPPQYFQPEYAHARFPVVLAFTGYPNDTWSVVKLLALPAIAARLTAEHKIKPAIYVMMNASPALPRDTECTNIPAGLQVATYFAEDVPLAVEHTFRAKSGASNWGVIGYSTGGFCAAKLAMLYPHQFGSAVAMAGYYAALQDPTTGSLYGGSTGYRDDNNLYWRLQHLPPPPVSVLVTSSWVGERGLPGALRFLSLIRPPMHGYSLIVPQGGHNYGTWRRELPRSLEWLSHRLSAPSPVIPGLPPATTASDRRADRSTSLSAAAAGDRRHDSGKAAGKARD
jgi:enterochelin esterase-like enzyme